MGLLDSIMQWHARNVFGNANQLAEPVIYTTQAGVSYPLNVIVERMQVMAAKENGWKRTRTVKFLLPRDPNGIKAPSMTQLQDSVTLPWNVGEPASKFGIVGNATQDNGAWLITADKSH